MYPNNFSISVFHLVAFEGLHCISPISYSPISVFAYFRVRLFRICLFRIRLFCVGLFCIRLFRVCLLRIRLPRVDLFRVLQFLDVSVFAYSVFAYSVFAYSIFAYIEFAYFVFAYRYIIIFSSANQFIVDIINILSRFRFALQIVIFLPTYMWEQRFFLKISSFMLNMDFEFGKFLPKLYE